MKIKATSTLRGEVVLASINRSLVADQELTINEEHYWKDDIQKALQFGLITIVEGSSTVATAPQRRYTLLSHNRNTLILPSVAGPIEPQQEFTVSEKAFISIDIQQALNYGLLEVVNISGDEPAIEIVEEDIVEAASAKSKKGGRTPKPLPQIAAPKRTTLKPEHKAPAKSAKTNGPKTLEAKVLATTKAPVKMATKLAAKHPVKHNALTAAKAAASKRGPKSIRPVGSGRRSLSNEDSGGYDDGIEMEIL